MALMALPPQFLVPLLGYKDKYLDTDWRLRLMVTSPSLEQIEMLEKGWSLASQLLSCEKPKRYNRDDLKNVFSDLSDLSDSSENSGPGNSKTEVRIKSRKVRVQSRKPDKKGEEAGHGKTILEATLELLNEHPDCAN
jgi:hypothetical protein